MSFRLQDYNSAAALMMFNQNAGSGPGIQVAHANTRNLQAASGGTTLRSVTDASLIAPNEKIVSTTIHKITATSLVSAQKNLITPSTSALSQGTGGFNNSLVTLLSRTDNILTFAGMCYAIAVFTTQLTGDDLLRTQQWMAAKLSLIHI